MYTPSQYKEALLVLALQLDEPALKDNVMHKLDACPEVVRILDKIASYQLSK